MSFAEQLAARAAAKQRSTTTTTTAAAAAVVPPPLSGIVENENGDDRRTSSSSSSSSFLSEGGRRATKNRPSPTAMASSSSARPPAREQQQQQPPPRRMSPRVTIPPKSQMSFGSAIKAKKQQQAAANAATTGGGGGDRSRCLDGDADNGSSSERPSFGSTLRAKRESIGDESAGSAAAAPVVVRPTATTREEKKKKPRGKIRPVADDFKKDDSNRSSSSSSSSLSFERSNSGKSRTEERLRKILNGQNISANERGGDDDNENDNENNNNNNNNNNDDTSREKGRNNNNTNSDNDARTKKTGSESDKLKTENKKLRRASILLKAKLEEFKRDLEQQQQQQEEDDEEYYKKEVEDDAGDGNNANVETAKRRTSKMRDSIASVRLTQILLDLGELEELEKLRTGQDDDDDDDLDAIEREANVLRLQNKLARTESELIEVTELKNAEIEVLRKQLNRSERRDSAKEKEKKWSEEREGYREEIRRLNVEMSGLRARCQRRQSEMDEEEEELGLTSRYSGSVLPSMLEAHTDDPDVESLQSIIAMMRQTIDQSNKEKDLLERRLAAEQERSQMELHSFARTLEGVDDLRRSAEVMGREIRKIKVKGYRPTRSDLFGGGGSGGSIGMGLDPSRGGIGGGRNFGELTAAVEASECMEDAIRLIENQNDAMEERRRMGVVASSANAAAGGGVVETQKGKGAPSWANLRSSEQDREGGFLSFWNGENGAPEREDGNRGKSNNASKEKKKKSKRKHKKRDDGGGSVLTSFF